ncbi:unnamed protein product [Moneuplotes crassus]|uniref:C2H2-type domain-containing protein n=1 Tax=Euplotes crassus TaxID=5936 RepID=A0AAD1U4S1_EUPCR|nr:unnamed protein product [Moneuplotes crassus]
MEPSRLIVISSANSGYRNMMVKTQEMMANLMGLPILNDLRLEPPRSMNELVLSHHESLAHAPPLTYISQELPKMSFNEFCSCMPTGLLIKTCGDEKHEITSNYSEEIKESPKGTQSKQSKSPVKEQIKVTGGTLKRRNNKFRDVREMKDDSLTNQDLMEEKKFLMKQYGIDSNLNYFNISYVSSEKFDKKKRIFSCNFEGCGRTFCKTWNLFDHLRIHTKEKPFKCKVCGRGFAQNGNLTKHEKVHLNADRRKYKCNICPKAYTEKYNLKIHKQKIHGIQAN